MIFNVVVDVIFNGGTTELNGSLFGLIALLFLILILFGSNINSNWFEGK